MPIAVVMGLAFMGWVPGLQREVRFTKLPAIADPMAVRGVVARFAPDIAPDDIKFVKALSGRDVQILRKWGSWENWLHDSAIITGPSRCYILVALTQHPDDADGQDAQRGEHEYTDQDREETVHTCTIGFGLDLWRAVRVR